MTSREQRARERLEAAGQGHVLAFLQELDERGRERLLAEVEALDLDLVARLRARLSSPEVEHQAPRFEPPETFSLERDAEREREAREAAQQGARLLSEGLVGYVLVAGGQGSRLGFDGPKGAFPVGPVTGCSLYEWHARRLQAAARRHGAPVVWYVMTSATNDAETRALFGEHGCFGLPEEDVHFFQQAMLPALDPEGRILLRAKDGMFLAPNGHGGSLEALARSGCLADAARRGIEYLSYFQVDNPLARPADPLFLGLHALEGAGMSSKVVAKRDAHEKVGVLGRADGRLGCIEYSDLPESLRTARDADGQLLFRAGNIALHVLERRFVEELTADGLDLPWHLARKRMAVLDESGRPAEREGVKFETFVFDALARTARSVTLEVERRLEFSPVKNAEGEDSPLACRRDLTSLFAEWVEAAGRRLPSRDSLGTVPLEVDPRFAEDRGEFLARLPAEPRVSARGELWA